MRIKIYIIFILLSISSFAQQKQIQTAIDTTKNKIGAQFTLSLKVKTTATSKVQFPNAPNFGALEVIESYPVDTLTDNGKYELIKKYGLTQFDSGKYVIPKLPILIDKLPVYSDSILVEVNNVVVDTLKQKMFDIKPIISVEKPAGNWWKYLLALIVLIGLAFLSYFLWNRYKKVPEKVIVYNSPIEKATSLLLLLTKKEFLEKGEIKNYYSELTDIARDYIEEAIQIPAKESTTSELIIALRAASVKKKLKLSKETVSGLETVLKQADLVKFAKSQPLDFEIEEDRKKIENSIHILDKSIPVVVDEKSIKWELQQQQLRIKKQQRNKIIIVSSIFAFILFSALAYIGYTKGLDYIKNGFTGFSTKEMLNDKWIKSEYGNPIIKIETPKVLTRMDFKNSLPKGTAALIKDFQSFGLGSLTGNFYVLVSTIQYKQEQKIELSESINASIHNLELTGFKDIIDKQEAFKTESGIEGLRGYGTFSNNNVRMSYQILVFGQAGGLQQILIYHNDKDENAKEITERILNSVELQTAN
jgi:hypothetical protein